LGRDLDPLDPADQHVAWTALEQRLDLATAKKAKNLTGTAAASTKMPQRFVARTPTPASQSLPWSRVPRRIAAMSAVGLVLLVGAVLGIRATHSRGTLDESSLTKVVSTTVGQRAMITLPDGTQLTLAPGSEVRYDPRFGRSGRRLVRLDGEAYFEVSRVSRTPFSVVTATSSTDVLGTAFTVRAYQSDSLVRVAVTEGKVALRARTSTPGTGTTLVNGDLGLITTAGLATVVRDVDVTQYTSWMQGKLTFHQTPLRDVITELERWYDVKIVVTDTALASAPLVGTLPTQSAEQAVARIAAVLNLRQTRQGQVITLAPRTTTLR
jgi:ferric-dicitrate binding protein FerR (iron transport regulator)